MRRSLKDLIFEPLSYGVWGVVLLLAFLGTGLSLAAVARRAPPPFNHAGAAIGCAFVVLAVWIMTRIVKTLSERSKALAMLPGPKYNWFLGMAWMLGVKDPHRYAKLWADKYGPLIRLRLVVFHGVMITDPALAMHVLYSPHFDKFEFVYSFLDPLLRGPSILTGPTDEHWKQVRKGVAPAFSTAHMREALRLVVMRSNQLVDFLKSRGTEEPQNIDKLLLRESMDVIGEFGFEKETNALKSLNEPNSKFDKGLSDVDVLLGATHEVEMRVTKPFRKMMLWRPELRFGTYLLSRYQTQVGQLLKHIKIGNPRKGSFAQLLLSTKHHSTGECPTNTASGSQFVGMYVGKPLTDKQMTPEIAALFFAGIDTTGHTGTWMLYLLTQHPEAEAKVVAELDSLELLVTADRPQPRELTYPDLAKLEYLQAVVKETLRMYPPVGIGQIRQAQTDVTLAGKLKIPKGTICWVPHYGIQNTIHNWEEPDSFIPERWLQPGTEYAKSLPLEKEWYEGLDLGGMGLNENGKLESSSEEHVGGSRRPKRYFPFAEGPRNCVGQNLAKVSLIGTAATLLSKVSFRLADQMGGAEGVRSREQYTLITGIENGMWMHAVPRA